MSFFRLIRLPNLVIVVLTQYLLYYFVIRRVLKASDISALLDDVHMGLLSLITVLITASGYIFNDIVDLKVDQINKPQKVVLVKKIPLQIAYWSAGFMLLVGFLISFYLAMKLDRLPYLFLFPLAVMGLLGYNLRWKATPLIGNIIIACYCAGVAGILWIAEKPALDDLFLANPHSYRLSLSLVVWYMIFAFFSTLIREIVKDLEDRNGDQELGLNTMPVAWGLKRSKLLVYIFSILLFLILGYFAWTFDNIFGKSTLAYLCFGIILPIAIAAILLIRSKNSLDFNRLSQLWKGIMVLGLLLLLFF